MLIRGDDRADKGRVSAELHRGTLHGRCALLHQLLADLGRARKRNLTDGRVWVISAPIAGAAPIITKNTPLPCRAQGGYLSEVAHHPSIWRVRHVHLGGRGDVRVKTAGNITTYRSLWLQFGRWQALTG
jgi:hypothetical protein